MNIYFKIDCWHLSWIFTLLIRWIVLLMERLIILEGLDFILLAAICSLLGPARLDLGNRLKHSMNIKLRLCLACSLSCNLLPFIKGLLLSIEWLWCFWISWVWRLHAEEYYPYPLSSDLDQPLFLIITSEYPIYFFKLQLSAMFCYWQTYLSSLKNAYEIWLLI